MSLFDERRVMVETRFKELVSLAEAKFGIKLPKIDLRFDLRGVKAGVAGAKPVSRYSDEYIYYIRINVDMMVNDSWNHLYKDTIPHELAHIVCFFNRTDFKHGKIWRETCRQLGGSGARCHHEPVVYSRGSTWYYVTKSGEVVRLSNTRHRRVQEGRVYLYRELGRVDRTCWYSNEAPRT